MRSLANILTLAIVILFLASCAGSNTDTPEPSTTVFLDDGNQLHYEGLLDADSNELLYSLFKQATVKPDTLVISSGGGDVLLGLDVGNWIYDNNLSVVIEKACLSSCANYIFTAANRKGLNKNSIIFWHGSSWQKNIDKLHRQGIEYFVALRKREIEFFKKIKVDHRITTYGLNRYSFWSRLGAFFTADPIVGFDFSIEDMAKFGVTDVYEVDGHWDWRKYTDCCNAKRMKINGAVL